MWRLFWRDTQYQHLLLPFAGEQLQDCHSSGGDGWLEESASEPGNQLGSLDILNGVCWIFGRKDY